MLLECCNSLHMCSPGRGQVLSFPRVSLAVIVHADFIAELVCLYSFRCVSGGTSMMAKTRLRKSNLSWLAMATAVAAMWLASSTPAFADALGTLSETNCADGGMTFTATTIV